MARPIPDAASVAKKWADRASGASGEWVNRIKQSTWKSDAIAGEDNFQKAMSEVVSKKLRMKGIEKSSDAKWQQGAADSETIFADKVRKAEGTMSTAIQQVLNDEKTIVAQLPKKGPRGSPGNYDRSRKVGEHLHDQKVKRMGA